MTTATRLTHVAKALDVPPRTLRRWVHEDRLRAVKRGGTWYVDILDAAELVQMRHARAGRRLPKSHNGRYYAVQSTALSPNPSPPPTWVEVGADCGIETSGIIRGIPLCDRHLLDTYRAVRDRMDAATPAPDPKPNPRARPLHGKLTQGLVYYVRLGNRIKIGWTTDLAKRMRVIPYEEILAIVPGTMSDEKREHTRWAHLRTSGEWFEATEDLYRHIAGIAADAVPVPPPNPLLAATVDDLSCD